MIPAMTALWKLTGFACWIELHRVGGWLEWICWRIG